MIKVFRSEATVINKSQVGQEKLVLVEGTSKRSSSALVGRNDGNTRTPPLPPPMPPPLQVPTTLPPTPSLTGSRPSHHSVW
nr:mitochondrial tRNA methylthiotransferase CDK5RAP1-like isoform X2 [Cherax quadricarinatus]